MQDTNISWRRASRLGNLLSLSVLLLATSVSIRPASAAQQASNAPEPDKTARSEPTETQETQPSPSDGRYVSRGAMLVGSLTVFFLAVFVGFEVITKVPPTLHTPLMSGSNAISGITVVGAMLTAGAASLGLGSILGMLALVLATINVVGGFLVTYRMLKMFQGSKK